MAEEAPAGADGKEEIKEKEKDVPEDAKADGKATSWLAFGVVAVAVLIGVIVWSTCRGKKAAANWKGKKNSAGYAGGNWGGNGGGDLADVEFSRVPD
jgi:hypothetical protein